MTVSHNEKGQEQYLRDLGVRKEDKQRSRGDENLGHGKSQGLEEHQTGRTESRGTGGDKFSTEIERGSEEKNTEENRLQRSSEKLGRSEGGKGSERERERRVANNEQPTPEETATIGQ